MTRSRRLLFNFEEIFNDHRRQCYLFVNDSNYKTIRDFKVHVLSGFNIKESIYFCDCNGILFPDFEDIRTLLECSDVVWVKRIKDSCDSLVEENRQKCLSMLVPCIPNSFRNEDAVSNDSSLYNITIEDTCKIDKKKKLKKRCKDNCVESMIEDVKFTSNDKKQDFELKTLESFASVENNVYDNAKNPDFETDREIEYNSKHETAVYTHNEDLSNNFYNITSGNKTMNSGINKSSDENVSVKNNLFFKNTENKFEVEMKEFLNDSFCEKVTTKRKRKRNRKKKTEYSNNSNSLLDKNEVINVKHEANIVDVSLKVRKHIRFESDDELSSTSISNIEICEHSSEVNKLNNGSTNLRNLWENASENAESDANVSVGILTEVAPINPNKGVASGYVSSSQENFRTRSRKINNNNDKSLLGKNKSTFMRNEEIVKVSVNGHKLKRFESNSESSSKRSDMERYEQGSEISKLSNVNGSNVPIKSLKNELDHDENITNDSRGILTENMTVNSNNGGSFCYKNKEHVTLNHMNTQFKKNWDQKEPELVFDELLKLKQHAQYYKSLNIKSPVFHRAPKGGGKLKNDVIMNTIMQRQDNIETSSAVSILGTRKLSDKGNELSESIVSADFNDTGENLINGLKNAEDSNVTDFNCSTNIDPLKNVPNFNDQHEDIMEGVALKVDDIVNFKILFLSQDYTPTISNNIIGRVVSISNEVLKFKILLGQEICKPLIGKFSLSDSDENEDKSESYEDIVELHVKDLIKPKKIINPFSMLNNNNSVTS